MNLGAPGIKRRQAAGLSAGSQKPVSTIFSGVKMRFCMKSPSDIPDNFSTIRPWISTETLYFHRVPGWATSGKAATRLMNSSLDLLPKTPVST